MSLSPVVHSSKRSDWRTPRAFFEALHLEFGFDLDVAATRDDAMLDRYLTPDDDALVLPWAPWRCWLNPPYGRGISRWLAKARAEAARGALVVVLVPARPDTRWWHEHVHGHAEVRWIRGRLRFEGAESGAPFPSAVLVYRPGGFPGGIRYDAEGRRVT